MAASIMNVTQTVTPYTLTNGTVKVPHNFVVRITENPTLVRFESNITGLTAVQTTNISDYNPMAEYYTISIPNNPLTSARNVKVYGYSITGSVVLLLDVYQAG